RFARGGLDHGHDAGLDGFGASIPGGGNLDKIRVQTTIVVDTRRRKRWLMWSFLPDYLGPALVRHRTQNPACLRGWINSVHWPVCSQGSRERSSTSPERVRNPNPSPLSRRSSRFLTPEG